jgi:hypothetical protein
MDLVELYYEMTGGYPSDTDEYKTKTRKIIDYLKDCNIAENDIVYFICTAPEANFITPQMLPDSLWEGSLLKRDKFYYHNKLHMTSKPPVWDPISGKEKVYEFFLEMKIQFTMKDLVHYFYKTLLIDTELLDIKRDTGSMIFLLNRYEKFKFIEAIDFLLSVIDYAASMDEERRIKSILDIQQYEGDVFEILQRKVAEATVAKANVIVWR